jgi:P-loop Domain of unknown function (DUF2791)
MNSLQGVTSEIAEGMIEDLRTGIPPKGYISFFTVGRVQERDQIEDSLSTKDNFHGTLVKANYGSGKTHLLRAIRESALENGYVVSLVTCNARGGVRFNRLNQVMGAICRQMEYPDSTEIGILPLLEKAANSDKTFTGLPSLLRDEIRTLKIWGNYQSGTPRNIYAIQSAVDVFEKPDDARFNPWSPDNYIMTKRVINALEKLARELGYKGVVLLFDEFEDVIQNLIRRDYIEKAYENFFHFLTPYLSSSKSFFAVTPEFVQKSIREFKRGGTYLKEVGEYTLNEATFGEIPTISIAPINLDDLLILSRKITSAHAIAYEWDAEAAASAHKLEGLISKKYFDAGQNHIRTMIQFITTSLDKIWKELHVE